MVLAILPMVELVEVAEDVRKPSDHLGTNPDRSFQKSLMKHISNFHFWSRIALLVLHLEVDSEGVS